MKLRFLNIILKLILALLLRHESSSSALSAAVLVEWEEVIPPTWSSSAGNKRTTGTTINNSTQSLNDPNRIVGSGTTTTSTHPLLTEEWVFEIEYFPLNDTVLFLEWLLQQPTRPTTRRQAKRSRCLHRFCFLPQRQRSDRNLLLWATFDASTGLLRLQHHDPEANETTANALIGTWKLQAQDMLTFQILPNIHGWAYLHKNLYNPREGPKLLRGCMVFEESNRKRFFFRPVVARFRAFQRQP